MVGPIVRAVRPVLVVLLAAWGAMFASCGPGALEGTIPPTGGELCSPERRFCLEVPATALAAATTFRISPSNERPGAELTEVWDVTAVGQQKLIFLKPATVRFKLEGVDVSGLRDESVVRISTLREGSWEVLGNAFNDRVKLELRGETSSLTNGKQKAQSAFTLLRTDRLSDGGLPMESDAGPLPDAGALIVPPIPDAGRGDAGAPVDAGRPEAGSPVDAGRPDAGSPVDAGSAVDAGAVVDAGTPVDAGTVVDAGPSIDAGTATDAGSPVDAGSRVDAGTSVDAGSFIDAGVDAGRPSDAGSTTDAGADAG